MGLSMASGQLGVIRLEVVVGIPAAQVALDEPDAALREPPGQQALGAEVGRGGVVEPVEVAGWPRSPSRCPASPGPRSAAGRPARTRRSAHRARRRARGSRRAAIHLGDQVELEPLEVAPGLAVADEGDPGLLRLQPAMPERRPLVGGGEEPRAEVVRAALREVLADRHVSREVLVLAAQPISDPRAHAGPDERVAAGVPFQHGTAVPRVRAVHRVDHAEVVGAPCQVREQRADPEPALAVLPERERRSHQVAHAIGERDDPRALLRRQADVRCRAPAAAWDRRCRGATGRRT